MNRQAFDPATFTSRMTKGELIAVLLYLPLHVWLLPLLLFCRRSPVHAALCGPLSPQGL